MEVSVYAFEVTVVGEPEWGRTINAARVGQAKSEYHRLLLDCFPEVPFTALRCRKVGAAKSSREFVRCAAYRGLPAVRCGQKVKVGAATGVIVGHNSSANFDVLFDEHSPKYAGLRLNVHPASLEVIT